MLGTLSLCPPYTGTTRLGRESLLPRLQPRKQLWRGCLHQPRRLCRRLLAEIEFLDAARAFLDLVGGDQDLPDVLVHVGEMLLQLQHTIAQASEIVAEIEHLGADL